MLIVIWVGLGCAPSSATAEQPYSEAEVRRDVSRYVATVFGDAEPTLADYNAFEGPKDEAEYRQELAECARRWGSAFESTQDGSKLNEECASWIAKRARNAGETQSLYYMQLRKKVNLSPEHFEIVTIQKPAEPRAAYRIFAKAAGVSGDVEFFHASDRGMADLGLMGLSAVAGKPVASIIGADDSPAARD